MALPSTVPNAPFLGFVGVVARERGRPIPPAWERNFREALDPASPESVQLLRAPGVLLVAEGGPAGRAHLFELPGGSVGAADVVWPDHQRGRPSPLPQDTEGLDRCFEALGVPYAFARVDARARSVLLGRSREGGRRLHVHAGVSFIVFGTSLRVLLACPGVPRRADPMRALAVLVPELEAACTRASIVRGIERVEAGTREVLGPRSRTTRRLPPLLPVELPRRHVEQADALADALRCAMVREQAGASRVGVLLSGGIDSGVVLGLLRDLHRDGSGPAPFAFAAHGREAQRCTEFEHVRAALRFGPLAGAVVLRGAASDAEIEDTYACLLARIDDPFPLTFWGFRAALTQAAGARSMDVVFTGVEGDMVYDVMPCALARDLASGNWSGWLDRAIGRARQMHERTTTTVWRHGVRPVLAKSLGRDGDAGWQRFVASFLHRARIRPAVRRAFDLDARLIGSFRERVWHPTGHWVTDAERLASRVACAPWAAAVERYAGLGDALGVRWAHPLLAHDVLRVALGFSPGFRAGRGASKWPLRVVGRGHMPERTRARQSGMNPVWSQPPAGLAGFRDEEERRACVARFEALTEASAEARTEACAQGSAGLLSSVSVLVLHRLLASLGIDEPYGGAPGS